jgi:hypothetical protein
MRSRLFVGRVGFHVRAQSSKRDDADYRVAILLLERNIVGQPISRLLRLASGDYCKAC